MKDFISKERATKELLVSRSIHPITGCWRYLGDLDAKGYASISIDGEIYRVHRLSLYAFKKLDLNNPKEFACHIRECPFKDCFNPDHLYNGNNSTNMKDSIAIGTNLERSKTHCKQGHEFNKKNTYITKLGKRSCRMCKNLDQQRRHKENQLILFNSLKKEEKDAK